MAWLRLYDEILDDPKVQRLPAEDFKAWVNLLCLARRNDGFLPDDETISFALRIDVIACRSLVDRLAIAGLIDTVKGGANGSRIAPHGWNKRQYKSDTSTERVKRFRGRYKDVPETPPETETDTETEKKEKQPPAAADYVFSGKVIHLTKADFDQWQRAYPALDLQARLQSRDDWLATEADERTRKRWFIATSNYLANLQQEAAQDQRQGGGLRVPC